MSKLLYFVKNILVLRKNEKPVGKMSSLFIIQKTEYLWTTVPLKTAFFSCPTAMVTNLYVNLNILNKF